MKRKMLLFSPELFRFLEKKIQTYGYDVRKKKMFGHEVFFSNGYMFSGANESGIFVHIGEEKRDEALRLEDGVIAFEPREGMVMKDYILLQKPAYSQDRRLKKWLDLSNSYLLSRPPKQKKKKTKLT